MEKFLQGISRAQLKSLKPGGLIAMSEEMLKAQRLYIESAFERAAATMPSVETFPNPLDWNTHVHVRAALEIAMSFCSVRDAQGSPLGTTIDEIAQRAVNAEAGSKKQWKLFQLEKF